MTFEYLKSKLEGVPSIAIEDLVVQIWSHYGYTVRRPEAQGRGVTAVASRTHPYPRKEVIRVEHSEDIINGSLIQQSAALPKQEDADNVIFVTTGSLTKDAEALADALGMVVVGFDGLCSTIDSADLYSTITEFVNVNDTREQSLHLEIVAERIVSNTATDSKQAVYETLLEYFEEHRSAPRINHQQTLNAFGVTGTDYSWEQSTTVSWPSKPELAAEDVANYLSKKLAERENSVIEPSVLASVLELELNENLGVPLTEASPLELAEWLVDEYDPSHAPLVIEDEILAVEPAEDSISSRESVATNKLRVAAAINRRYEEEY